MTGHRTHFACGGAEHELSGAPVYAAAGFPYAPAKETIGANKVTIDKRAEANHRRVRKSGGDERMTE
ncbi:MAG: hypothetical protein HXY21_09165 [Parvularculaceae bacterium]|nr:hypothetical protein [Parvularculaceae bacterium]